MTVRLSPRARRDLAEVAAYVDAFGPDAASRVIGAIESTIIRCGRSPLVGRLQDVPGVRRMVTRRYGYLVYYRLADDDRTVDILSIRHGRQRRPYFDR